MPKLVQERKVDGIIVIGKMMDTYLQHLNTEAGIPVIYLDYYNGREASDSVISNSYYGTYELTYYLYWMGHHKIAYVGTLACYREYYGPVFWLSEGSFGAGTGAEKGMGRGRSAH